MFILVKCIATQTHFLKKWVVLHVSLASQYVPLSFAHKVGGFTSNPPMRAPIKGSKQKSKGKLEN